MDQTYEDLIRRRKKLINEWQNSSIYKDRCCELSDYVVGLVHKAKQYIPLCLDAINYIPARTEIGSDSVMHRGFYCPSLIYDIINGNVRRGKLLKRLSPKSKSYFIYCFDQDDKLVLCKEFYNGHLTLVEHLFYDENHVYGVRLEMDGRLHGVFLETYDNEKIVRYERLEIFDANRVNECCHLCREDYEYDSVGLKKCYQYEFYPQHNAYFEDRHTFDWEEGRMAGYLSERIVGDTVLFSGNYRL